MIVKPSQRDICWDGRNILRLRDDDLAKPGPRVRQQRLGLRRQRVRDEAKTWSIAFKRITHYARMSRKKRGAATIFMSKAGYEKAAQPKEWFEIPGATHHRLYDNEAAVGKAVAKLEEFFARSL